MQLRVQERAIFRVVVSAAFLLAGTMAGPLPGQAWLVRDIGVNPDPSSGSEPSNFVAAADHACFVADDGMHGSELWCSDGTADGTSLMADLFPGPVGGLQHEYADVAALEGIVYFRAEDDLGGEELWRTDGTPQGTWQVLDIHPGPGSSEPENFAVHDGALYFRADDGVHGPELWRTDGTTSGTWMVKDLDDGDRGSSPHRLTPSAGGLYFFAWIRFQETLFVTDGTQQGTVTLGEVEAPSQWNEMPCAAALGGRLLFAGWDEARGGEVWVSDGTPAGTGLLLDIRPGEEGSFPRWFVSDGNQVFFAADDGATGRELWRSDGTPAGTARVKDIRPGPDAGDPREIIPAAGGIFFQAADAEAGTELWGSDGTEAGTYRVLDINPGDDGSSPTSLTMLGDTLLFAALLARLLRLPLAQRRYGAGDPPPVRPGVGIRYGPSRHGRGAGPAPVPSQWGRPGVGAVGERRHAGRNEPGPGDPQDRAHGESVRTHRPGRDPPLQPGASGRLRRIG